jgi:hypothetical protein
MHPQHALPSSPGDTLSMCVRCLRETPSALFSGQGKGQRGATDANESSPSPHHRVRTPREERSTRLSLSCLTSLRSAHAPAPRLHWSHWFCRTVWLLG